jgi:hypothetical protein
MLPHMLQANQCLLHASFAGVLSAAAAAACAVVRHMVESMIVLLAAHQIACTAGDVLNGDMSQA